jgi:DNA-directed RNA polymerase subunit RPC12/RpoP
MGKCVRCGNEIDAIAKDPSKIFYCKECSFEVLKRSSRNFIEMDEEEEIIITGKIIYFLIPGIFQLKNKMRLNSLVCFFALLIFIYSLIYFKSIDLRFKYLIYTNTFLIYLKNFNEIKRG